MTDELRRAPAQDRSARRLDLILDTAAALLDEESGIPTPTAIGRRAGMSHAAVYRYFADAEAVVRALAARNLERFLTATAHVLADPGITWQDALRAAADRYADLLRHEPGFRRVRFGDGIDIHALSDSHTNKQVIADALVRYFAGRFELWDRPGFLAHVEALLEISDALITRAFLTDRDGDPFFLDEAKRVAVGYMQQILDVPGTPPTSPRG